MLPSDTAVANDRIPPRGGSMQDAAGYDRLEVGIFPIQHLAFAPQTSYDAGTLYIDRSALLAAIAEPRTIGAMEVHLAHPGESCRIIHILDAVAPMVKLHGRSTVYPGLFGPAIPAGSWKNKLLRGAALLGCG